MDGFATANAWGYRIFQQLDYNALWLGLTYSPNLLFAHDVKGTAIGPGPNFVEGRKEVDLGLQVRSSQLWSSNLVYTWYTGGGPYNLVRDRDNVLLNLIFNF